MFTFDKTDLQRFAVSSIGAVALTAASIFAAAAPVRAETITATAPLTIADWQSKVSAKIARVSMPMSTTAMPGDLREAVVAVRFTADGDYAGASVARSTGSRTLDAEALRVAGRVAYPALPMGYRGAAQTVSLRLFFGTATNGVDYAAKLAEIDRLTKLASVHNGGVQLAAR